VNTPYRPRWISVIITICLVKSMRKTTKFLPGPAPPDPRPAAPDEAAYSLNVTGVYQDDVTRSWAVDTCRRASHLAGEEHIRDSWFIATSLSDPETLREAVQSALAADVIVISIYAVDELSLDLRVWIDTWLPRRLSRAGALAAVIGAAEPLGSRFARTYGFLEEVARKAELDFIPHERPLPASSAVPPRQPKAAPTGDDNQLFLKLLDPPGRDYPRGGIND
jgi:hypothetical protein